MSHCGQNRTAHPLRKSCELYPQNILRICLFIDYTCGCNAPFDTATWQGYYYTPSPASQTLTSVLPWRYFVDVTKVNTWLTLSTMTLDNLGGSDSVRWSLQNRADTSLDSVPFVATHKDRFTSHYDVNTHSGAHASKTKVHKRVVIVKPLTKQLLHAKNWSNIYWPS